MKRLSFLMALAALCGALAVSGPAEAFKVPVSAAPAGTVDLPVWRGGFAWQLGVGRKPLGLESRLGLGACDRPMPGWAAGLLH